MASAPVLHSPSEAQPSTPWTRLRSAFAYAFERVEPGQEVAPVPPALREWSLNTSLAVLLGIVLFGGRQSLRNRQAQVAAQKLAKDAPTKLHAARAIAEENTQRLLKTFREAIRGAAICGTAVGGYVGVRELSAVAHGRHNATTDLAYAGGLTGALLGATVYGAPSRVASAILGGAVAAAASYPVALIDDYVRGLLPPDDPRRRQYSELPTQEDADRPQGQSDQDYAKQYPALGANAIDGVIQQLESGVSRRDTLRK